MDTLTIRKPIPFYGSYAGFYRAMWALKSKGLPRVIEIRTFQDKNLESEASRIVSGFSALDWTDEAGRPGEEFKKLVNAFGTDLWSPVIAEALPRAYPYLEDFDLRSGTSEELRQSFISYLGRDVPSLRNAETFFLCLSAEAGRAMTERLARRADRGVTDARKWLKRAQAGTLDEEERPDIFETRLSVERVATIKEPESINTKVVELLGLLMAKPEKTDGDAALGAALLSYLEHKFK